MMKEISLAVITSITILGSLYLICQTWEKTEKVQKESYITRVCKTEMERLDYYQISKRTEALMDKLRKEKETKE